MRKVQKIYSKRSDFTKRLDKFWHIVLSQHPEFSEYIRSEDFKYLELIKDIYVKWDVADESNTDSDPADFSLTFDFEEAEGDFPAQTIRKSFKIEHIDPEEVASAAAAASKKKSNNLSDDEDEVEIDTERLVSEPVDIIWPKSCDLINPSKITDKKTPQGKKNYRTGMKSFFGWFRWTGRKPGKEFPSGGDFARLFADDIFSNAVKYYTEAQRDGLEEEIDSEASEPLDLSEDDTEEPKKKRKLDE